MKLRDYQQAAIEALFAWFGEHRDGNPLICLPTGTGKSVVISHLVAGVFDIDATSRVLVLTHQKELIDQNYKTLLKVWPLAPVGIFSAGLKSKDHTKPITFCGIQSVHKLAEWFGHVDLVVIDEAHLVNPNEATMYTRFLRALRARNPRLRVIGFTATPYRIGGFLIDGDNRLFTDIAFDNTQKDAFNALIEAGWLAPLVTIKTDTEIDTRSTRIQSGDFVASDLAKKILADAPNLFRAVNETIERGVGRHHWLIFTVSIEHAKAVVEHLKDKGVPTSLVHSKQSDELNKSELTAFKAGETRACVNVGCLTTGFDFPAIDLIALMRPTRSPVLYVQMCGRGTRPSKDKIDCLVLDFGRVIEALGPINDPILPRGKKGLDDCPKCKGYRAEKDEEGLPVRDKCPECGKPFFVPVKACPSCGYYCATGAKVCPKCGEEFPRETKIEQFAARDAIIIAGPAPKVFDFRVDAVFLEVKETRTGFRALRVVYHCGLGTVEEWVCIGHPASSMGRVSAHRWWWRASFGTIPLPETADEALSIAHRVHFAQTLQCVKRGKYFDIVDRRFGETNPPFSRTERPSKLLGFTR